MKKIFILALLSLFVVACKSNNVTEEDKELSVKISNSNISSSANPGDNYFFSGIVNLNNEELHPTLIEVSINKVINVYGNDLKLRDYSLIDLIKENVNDVYYLESDEVDVNALGQFYLYDINYLYDYKTNEKVDDKVSFFYCFKFSKLLPGKYIIARDMTKDKECYDDFSYYDFAYMLYNNLEVVDENYVLLFDDRKDVTFTFSKSFYEDYANKIYDEFLIPDNFYINNNGTDYYKISFVDLLNALNNN